MLRATVVDVDPQDPTRVWVTIPQKYGNDSIKAVTRISVTKGDQVYVTDTSVTRVPQWVVFDQMNVVGSWGNPYPHEHPMGQVTGLVSKLGEITANITKLFDRTKNAKDYGAKGDGVADDTAALQAAVDASAGRELVIPPGRYKVSGSGVRVPAGTTVTGQPGAVLFSDDEALTSIIWASGYYSGVYRRDLAAPVGVGDRTITTTVAHGYKPGDVVRLQSQRVATSDDAGEWRLGWATIGGPGPFFSEFVTVEDVLTTTKFTTRSGLIFPGYRPDKTQDKDPNADTTSRLMKSDGAADNIIIRGLTIEGKAKIAVRIIRGMNTRVEDCTITLDTPGRAVQFLDCYRSEAKRCTATGKTTLYVAEDHAIQNLFHMIACQSSGFSECTAVQGSQCYDITYSSGALFPSVYCYVDNCKSLNSMFNPVTAHPGTYGLRITNNDFSECRDAGIAIRSNSALVSGNQVTGSNASGRAGIYCSEGGGKNSLISDNIVKGFDVGLQVNDGGDKPFNGWIGVTFTNNVVEDFSLGVKRIVDYGTPYPSSSQGFIIKGNTFLSDRADAVGVQTCQDGRGINGMEITNNSFRLKGTGTRGVMVTANSVNTFVMGNVFHGVVQVLNWDTVGLSDNSPVANVTYWQNKKLGSTAGPATPPAGGKFVLETT